MKTTASAIAFIALLGASAAAHAADYRGWWWSAATDGMGLNVEQQGDTMAVAWYHFDEDRSPSYVLLAGKLIDGVLSGELQTASGPPPGPGYDPANVTRNAVGTATLTFTPPASGSDQTAATLEYTLNGHSGSFELARFIAQPTPLTGSWKAFYSSGEQVIATMENTGGNHYRLTTKQYDRDGTFRPPFRVYDLNLSGSGPVFTGSGRLSYTGDFFQWIIDIKRLQVENGVLVFEYVNKESEADQAPSDAALQLLVGFPPPYDGLPQAEGTGFYQSGWWWDPSKNGMGVNIEQQGDKIAVAWYHFDEDRSPAYALLAGTLAGNTLSGELQTASGPPPGPNYDPTDVSRTTAGTATLRFVSTDSATFEYTLNGHSGSLDLSRFTAEPIPLATGSWKYNAASAEWACVNVGNVPATGNTDSGTVTMEKTGDKLYRLTTQNDSGTESCEYDLELTQSGPIFAGNGRFSCFDSDGSPISPHLIHPVTVRRLQTENGTLVFDYTTFYDENKSNSCARYGSLSGTQYDDTNP